MHVSASCNNIPAYLQEKMRKLISAWRAEGILSGSELAELESAVPADWQMVSGTQAGLPISQSASLSMDSGKVGCNMHALAHLAAS